MLNVLPFRLEVAMPKPHDRWSIIESAAWIYVARRAATGLLLLGIVALAGFMLFTAFVRTLSR